MSSLIFGIRLSHCSRYVEVSHCSHILYSPNGKWCGMSFPMLVCHIYTNFFFDDVSIQIFYPFLTGLFPFCWDFFIYILDRSPLFHVWFANISSQSVTFFPHLFNSIFHSTEVLHFIKGQLSMFSFIGIFVIVSKNSLPKQIEYIKKSSKFLKHFIYTCLSNLKLKEWLEYIFLILVQFEVSVGRIIA